MGRGRQYGADERADLGGRRRLHLGIDLFLEEGAYTTLASAVAMLMLLALLFSASAAIWTSARSSDVQVAADATALAGSNVVASYHTAATVVDASILTLGLTGFAMAGAGLVGLLIPGANAAAGKTLDAAMRVLKTRNEFAASASRGLEKLEGSLPYLIAANASRTCAAQSTERLSYAGTALAVPRASASEFPASEGGGIQTDALEQTSSDLDRAADELAEAAEHTAKAKEAAWLADCGRDGMNMQERASKLSGISAAENPDYASSITWEPNVALDRARAYYRWRFDHDRPEGPGTEAAADAAARHVFYGYALEVLGQAEVVERDGTVVSTVELLPKNTDEVRATRLYTDAVWPSTKEDGGLVLHYGADCSGAKGAPGPLLALKAIEIGAAQECATCRFSVGDVGKTPAASTSIDNGFEYHLREFTLALDAYVEARNRELELERQVKDEADAAGDAFEDALSVLAGKRPRIAPPGCDGCVALVTSGAVSTPDEMENAFASGTELQARGAIAASVLAPELASDGGNVLADFLSSLESRGGAGGAVGLIDNVMDLWGRLLISYGDLGSHLGDLTDELLGGLKTLGGGPIADWLSSRIDSAVRGLGLEAIDLRLRKPVLTDSANVIARADTPGLADAQELLRSIPASSTDPVALLQAIGYEVGERLLSLEFTFAEIPLPGGGSIPLTIRLRDVAVAVGGGP